MKTIALTNGGVTVVSDRDYSYLRRWAWTRRPDNYAVRYEGNSRKPKNRRTVYLHLVVARRAGKCGRPQVDHRDLDRLNNCRSNLRVATMMEQRANQTKQRNNTSGFKGVFWHEPTGKWMAQIGVRRRHIYLGLFTSKRNAAQAYNQAARKHFGKFACLNKV